MKCPKCAYDNPEGSSYCGLCYEVIKKEPPAASGASPELAAAIRGICELDTPETRTRLYTALLDAVLFVPVDDPAAPAALELDQGERIPLYDLKPGFMAMVVFTGEQAFLEGPHRAASAVKILGRDLFLLASHFNVQSIGINPGGAGGWLTETEIRRLAEGIVPVVDDRGHLPAPEGKVSCAPYPEMHPQFADELCIHLDRWPEVRAAYALLASFHDAPPRLLLAVSCPGQDSASNADSYMPRLIDAAKRRGIDAYAMIVQEHDWLGEATKSVAPFYTRAGV